MDVMDPDFQAWYKEAKSLEKRFVEAIHHLDSRQDALDEALSRLSSRLAVSEKRLTS